jgi:hypothetical protein
VITVEAVEVDMEVPATLDQADMVEIDTLGALPMVDKEDLHMVDKDPHPMVVKEVLHMDKEVMEAEQEEGSVTRTLETT